MKISEREMIWCTLTGTILFGGTWYYVFDSKIPEYKNKQIEIERLEAQLRLDQRRISMQKNWMDTLNSLPKDLQVFDIKQKSVSPQLMQTIKNISTKHGIRIAKSTMQRSQRVIFSKWASTAHGKVS